MDSRTFKLRVTISAITAVMGLTACNETGFSLSTQGQAELDKLNPIQPPVPPAGNPPANPPSDPAPVPSSTQAPAPVPTAPAPVPTSTAPAPKPTVPAPVPTETAPAPTPTAPPAPKPTVPAPVPTPTAPAPVPTPTAPAPKPTVPAPVPTPTAPAPVPTSTAPAPVPTQPAPVPSPVPTVVPSKTPTAKIGDGLNEFNPPKVETRPMVDILFVVDNSSSMQDNQNVLAQSFGSFIKAFREKDVDARFGIITTDTTPASVKTKSGKPYWEDGKLNGYYRPGPGNLLSKFSNPVWVSHDDKDLIGHFTANVRVGTSGSGSEMSIQSLELALADSKISKGGFNEGFIRDEAMLSLVIVSDEDNNITEKGVTPDALIDRLRTRLAAVKGSKSRGYSCDLVIDMSAKAPKGPITYPLANTMNSYPNVYLKAADKMGCRKLDIAKNWGSDLAKIGYQIVSQAEKEFKLSAKPIDGSIVVKIDGKVIAADAKNGYVYHADRNTIELMGDALASSAGAKVTVEYKYNQ